MDHYLDQRVPKDSENTEFTSKLIVYCELATVCHVNLLLFIFSHLSSWCSVDDVKRKQNRSLGEALRYSIHLRPRIPDKSSEICTFLFYRPRERIYVSSG